MDYTLTLTPEEAAALTDLVTREGQSDREELHHTSNREYREDVKLRTEVIQRLQRKLESLTSSVAK